MGVEETCMYDGCSGVGDGTGKPKFPVWQYSMKKKL